VKDKIYGQFVDIERRLFDAIDVLKEISNGEHCLEGVEKIGMMPPFNFDEFIKDRNHHGIEQANGYEWESETDSEPEGK
jgi:hypothetical protein